MRAADGKLIPQFHWPSNLYLKYKCKQFHTCLKQAGDHLSGQFISYVPMSGVGVRGDLKIFEGVWGRLQTGLQKRYLKVKSSSLVNCKM